MSAEPIVLAEESIAALADAIAARLRGEPEPSTPARLVSAQELATRLGVSRAWVYRNADALGAVRLPSSPEADRTRRPESQARGRLRFDLEAAQAASVRVVLGRSQAENASNGGRVERGAAPRSRRSPIRSPKPGRLLASRPRPASSVGGSHDAA